jgi:hypothetical protein
MKRQQTEDRVEDQLEPGIIFLDRSASIRPPAGRACNLALRARSTETRAEIKDLYYTTRIRVHAEWSCMHVSMCRHGRAGVRRLAGRAPRRRTVPGPVTYKTRARGKAKLHGCMHAARHGARICMRHVWFIYRTSRRAAGRNNAWKACTIIPMFMASSILQKKKCPCCSETQHIEN